GGYTSGHRLMIRCQNNVLRCYREIGGTIDNLFYTFPNPADTYYSFPLYVGCAVACLNKQVQAWVCNGETDGTASIGDASGVGGGSETTAAAAPTKAVLVDRIFRDSDLFAGIPGFYWGAAPTNPGAWAAASLFVDRGGGHAEIAEVETAAIVGV